MIIAAASVSHAFMNVWFQFIFSLNRTLQKLAPSISAALITKNLNWMEKSSVSQFAARNVLMDIAKARGSASVKLDSLVQPANRNAPSISSEKCVISSAFAGTKIG